MPFWRSLDKTLAQADRKMTSLADRAAAIDAQMEQFEQIVKKSDKAEHALTVSALTQFFVASLVLAIAAGGALINFKLIALPMSEMVGAGDYLTATLRTSEVAALVIIFVEAAMGLFLMETLRITHLFPKIHGLPERMRVRMMWVAFVLLVALAGIEAALALMRDMLIADKQALLQSLAAQQAAVQDGWLTRIPTIGQMLLGFILPFALAFIAIPLESWVNSARTVGGAALVMLVRAIAVLLRIAGTIVRRLMRVLTTLYDIVIVLPLLVERLVVNGRGAAGKPVAKPARTDFTVGERS
jgi:cell division protein FtsB